jgi:hypothetical protein
MPTSGPMSLFWTSALETGKTPSAGLMKLSCQIGARVFASNA